MSTNRLVDQKTINLFCSCFQAKCQTRAVQCITLKDWKETKSWEQLYTFLRLNDKKNGSWSHHALCVCLCGRCNPNEPHAVLGPNNM